VARIVVCGYMVRHPVAGNMFAYLHYILGLRLLGHEVAYIEESGWPFSCYDPVIRSYTEDPLLGLQRVRSLLTSCGLDTHVCYVERHSGEVHGATWAEVMRLLGSADLLLNVGGVCWLPEFRLCKHLALVDMDPFFTQAGRFAKEGLEEYGTYFSYGANIGAEGCGVPTAGIAWTPAVPPVVPELWECATPAESAPFTTIANWRAYGPVIYKGESYGQKDVEFMRMLDLPSHVERRLELALSGIDAQETEVLKNAGWHVVDGDSISLDVSTYKSYIRASRGELSVAKNAYVKSNSGWFSDRSVCYLASGLPVVLQDTGFTEWLPTGKGVLAFSSVEEAARCIAEVDADYDAHRHAARKVAEQVFSYKVALPMILDVCERGSLGRPPASRANV
jgi:hypothetical protein